MTKTDPHAWYRLATIGGDYKKYAHYWNGWLRHCLEEQGFDESDESDERWPKDTDGQPIDLPELERPEFGDIAKPFPNGDCPDYSKLKDGVISPPIDLSESAIINFAGLEFSDIAVFSGLVFALPVKFVRVTFNHWTNFEGATFTRDAHFEGATFNSLAHFQGATFTERAHI